VTLRRSCRRVTAGRPWQRESLTPGRDAVPYTPSLASAAEAPLPLRPPRPLATYTTPSKRIGSAAQVDGCGLATGLNDR
jgi:hypothetical protein